MNGMTPRTLTIDGFQVPRFLYGTAWKEEATERLTALALKEGFRGIDTANQRKHYYEAAVGRAVVAGSVQRNDLFLQTKFTHCGGQDHRLPYDPNAPVAEQVEQSFASSLDHFGTTWIDSYVLHGPTYREGLADEDWAAWRAMEAIHDSGRAKLLGVSNVSLGQLDELVRGARVKPRFVQNRCYAAHGWDRQVRQYCSANDIVYQGFSLLTANRNVLTHPETVRLAKAYGKTPTQIVFRFCLEVGMVVLTGTTDAGHMREDLSTFDFTLRPEEVARIDKLIEG
jgi:diketogulonate reductase-like aldo/keto reductase